MTTGANFANITDKSILGFRDFKDRWLTHLRTLAADVTRAQWDVDGVYNNALTLSSPGDDTIQVDGSSRATDGVGHIFDPANIPAGEKSVPFENDFSVNYEVGFKYAERPRTIRLNTRTGAPEYGYFEEIVGESADPTSVVNNGSTLTFNVNSVTEAGVDNTGRQVLVFKKTPALGALTESVAIQVLTVGFSGGNNTVTTADLMGQTAPSTTASDYTVILLGISVKRNLSIEAATGFTFIGVVEGTGSPSTPTNFDETNQRIIKTFQDASQIQFTPYQWLTATNVQSALQQVVDVLGGASGADQVGINATSWTRRIASSAAALFTESWGGYGNVADGTFTGGVDAVQDALTQASYGLERNRTFITAGDSNSATHYPALTSLNDARAQGGCWFVRTNGTSTPMEISGNQGAFPYILFEQDDDQAFVQLFQPVEMSGGGDVRGKWERVAMYSADASVISFESAQMENFWIRSGDVSVNGPTRVGGQAQCVFEKGEFSPDGTPTSRPAIAFTSGSSAIFRDCYIEAESGQVCVDLTNVTEPVLFENCVFFGDSAAHVISGTPSTEGLVTFRNCVFQGHGANEQFVINVTCNQGSSGNGQAIIFTDCHVIAPTGGAIQASGSGIRINNMFIVAGQNGGAVSNDQKPTAILTDAQINGFFAFIDDDAVWPTVASAHLVQMIGCQATNIEIWDYTIDTSGANASGILRLTGNDADPGQYTNIKLEHRGNWMSTGGAVNQVGFVEIEGTGNKPAVHVDNLNVYAFEGPQTGAAGDEIIMLKVVEEAWVKNVNVRIPSFSVVDSMYAAIWARGNNIDLQNVHVSPGNATFNADNFEHLFYIGGQNSSYRNFNMAVSLIRNGVGTEGDLLNIDMLAGPAWYENFNLTASDDESNSNPICNIGLDEGAHFTGNDITISGDHYNAAPAAPFHFFQTTAEGRAFILTNRLQSVSDGANENVVIVDIDESIIQANIIDGGTAPDNHILNNGTGNLGGPGASNIFR